MTNCNCIECDHKCYEYYNNSTSDKAYYEWTYKQDKCLQAESEVQEADKESGVVFKTICNSCIVCHKETIDPNPFYICDTCKEKLKADKAESEE